MGADNHQSLDLEKVETVSTIIVNFGSMLGWILSVGTFIALAVQTDPIQIEDFLELGKTFQFIFLVCLFFTYIQILQFIWGKQKVTDKNTESKFRYFMYASMFKFRRIWVYSGFLILIALLFGFFSIQTMSFFVLFAIVSLIALGVSALEGKHAWYRKLLWVNDEELIQSWDKRIDRSLRQNENYINTNFFKDSAFNLEQANWAIKNFFYKYESRGLILKIRKEGISSYPKVDLLELYYDNVEFEE